MSQSFINLGPGYSDFFEFEELIHYNHERIRSVIALHTTLEKEPKTSILVIMKPTRQGHFQGIYATFETLPYPYPTSHKRFDFIKSWADEYQLPFLEFEVKAKHYFHEQALYYNYLTGVLRLQRQLPPL
ncbi:hypothetical protein ERX37_04180 [Macrococcus hajekii]|uniref:DUF7147 domain-containing protein n=1 Tax=Macrococcus hajekii TaxID=198482 RepID=A0A4R6BNC2_9STAP|nr:hypothetical protein [Macrococcus hajekii]TDM03291.1 hypothetical protein ERX37_04180 [Macrococcus hajekii]GGA97637.1 hypothetical protein GCM10007190_02030 [Macrococcus hajekii]